jgi:hypothetical protein
VAAAALINETFAVQHRYYAEYPNLGTLHKGHTQDIPVILGTVIRVCLQEYSHRVLSVAYSPDGQYIASGSDDATIQIRDAKAGAPVREPFERHADIVWSVAYSPDCQYIISGSFDRSVRIWDAKTGDAVGKPLRDHIDSVDCVSYSPDWQYIFSVSMDSTICKWNAFPHPSITPLTHCMPISMPGQARMVGFETHKVAYCIGYPLTIVPFGIRLCFWPSLQLSQFLLILRMLPLGPVGPQFSKVNSPMRLLYFLIWFAVVIMAGNPRPTCDDCTPSVAGFVHKSCAIVVENLGLTYHRQEASTFPP